MFNPALAAGHVGYRRSPGGHSLHDDDDAASVERAEEYI
jgi:hypothetical protein